MAADGTHYCPICEQRMSASICPTDGVHTILRTALEPRQRDLSEGTELAGRFRLGPRLGSGAMGTVYTAEQLGMNRTVAVKVLQRDLLGANEGLKRFYREARSASQLDHPNVVKMIDFGVDDALRLPFIAMERIDGRTLRALMEAEGRLPLARAARILQQVARALTAAHAARIVHRDLKPENIMISVLPDDEEHATVLDFGIAKPLPEPGDSKDNLTVSGTVVGTPRYMSPEQARGEKVDPRSDLYSLGCIFHELLTGRPPCHANDLVELVLMHTHSSPPPLPADIADAGPPGLPRLHLALLAKAPEDRPSSAAEVGRAFTALAKGADVPDSVVTAHPEPVEDATPAPATPAGSGAAPPARARPVFLLAGAAAVALLGVEALRLTAQPSPTTLGGPVAHRPVPSRAKLPPSAMTAEAPGGGVSALREATTPTAAAARLLEVRSHPIGVAVRVGDERLGRTPIIVEVPPEGVELELRGPGYRPERVRVGIRTPSPLRVEMRAAAARPPP